jgi:hypothetical protein
MVLNLIDATRAFSNGAAFSPFTLGYVSLFALQAKVTFPINSTLFFMVPFFYGVFSSLMYVVIQFFEIEAMGWRFLLTAIAGALMGFLFCLHGFLVQGLPLRVFGKYTRASTAWLHVQAMLLYFFIFLNIAAVNELTVRY